MDLRATLPPPDPDRVSSFRRDGFVVLPSVVPSRTVDALNARLEHVLRGRYDLGRPPDKRPPELVFGEMPAEMTTTEKATATAKTQAEDVECDGEEGGKPETAAREGSTMGPLGVVIQRGDEHCDDRNDVVVAERRRNKTNESSTGKGRKKAKNGKVKTDNGNKKAKVLQIVNVSKSDALFRSLVTSEALGRAVCEFAGWTGVGTRLAQDQVWAKPPGAPPLAYHRDSPYFMFDPPDVVTVWIALDDMTPDVGPLRYVKGSHLWGEGRVGSAGKFFQSDGGTGLLHSAARRAGIEDPESTLEVVSTAGLGRGGLSIHDGRTWHGSGGKVSGEGGGGGKGTGGRPRRGIGLHFVPANVQFTEDASKSRLWGRYVKGAMEEEGRTVRDVEVPEVDFPVVWKPPSSSS